MNRRIFLAMMTMLALSLSGVSAQTYTWTTIAGTAGVIGVANGTNGAASFYTPLGMTMDSAGNLYVTDHGSQLVRKIAPVGTNWVVTTIIGSPFNASNTNGTNSNGAVNDPYGLTIDASNTIYLADSFDRSIRKIYAVGTNWVIGLVVGSNNSGQIGTADGTNNAARFVYPVGVTIDSSNNLYVTDTTNDTIRLVTPVTTNWVVSTIAGLPGAANYYPNPCFVDGTNSNARFFFPSGIICDRSNNFYIADTYNNAIRKMVHVGTNWIVTTLAGTGYGITGSADGTNSAAQFNGPGGVITDNAGNLFVTDAGNDTIRKMTHIGTNWVTTTIAGIPGTAGSTDGTNALFSGPAAILVLSNGVLFVVDSSNNTIRQGTPVAAPSITAPPQPLSVTNGYAANFYVGATGTAPLFYQWQNGGTNLTDGGIFSGSLTTNLALSTTTTNNAGGYAVIISNTWGSVTSSVVNLTIIVPNPDSVGDGITDAWRAQYFGGSGTTTNSSSCATCDADATGQNNKFKYIAGLDPTNPASIFQLVVAAVTNLPAEHLLIFNPINPGRTYTPQFATNLPASVWSPLTSFTGPTTNGNQATVTDLDGTEPNKFYHINITFP